MITLEDINKAHFRAVLFTDGEQGMASQHFVCVEHPRLTVLRERLSRHSSMRQLLFVDGLQAKDVDDVVRRLNEAPHDPTAEG